MTEGVRVCRRKSDGLILPYNVHLAENPAMEVLEGYTPGAPTKAVRKPRKTKPKAAPTGPVVGEDPDAVLADLTAGLEGNGDGLDA